MKPQQIKKKIAEVKNWYHQIELAPGIITPGVNNSKQFLKQLKLPKDCRQKRILDIGTRDGFFAFEMEKRGATVVALDYVPQTSTGFSIAKKVLNSKRVVYYQDNIYNITPKKYGKFDIVLFLGLLYHLPDPIKALNIVRSVCKKDIYVETQGIDNAFLTPEGKLVSLNSLSPLLTKSSLMQFYPKNSLNNDPSNYWAPNLTCLKGMLEETGYKIVTASVHGSRLVAHGQITNDLKTKEVMNIATGISKPKSW